MAGGGALTWHVQIRCSMSNTKKILKYDESFGFQDSQYCVCWLFCWFLGLSSEIRQTFQIFDHRHYRSIFRLELPTRSPAHVMQRLDDEGREGDAYLSMPIEKVC